MFEVKMQFYEDLSDQEKGDANDDGPEKEFASYIRVLVDDKTILLKNDAMEPEDCTFGRDLHWIIGALYAAYYAGLKDFLSDQESLK